MCGPRRRTYGTASTRIAGLMMMDVTASGSARFVVAAERRNPATRDMLRKELEEEDAAGDATAMLAGEKGLNRLERLVG
eukprot:4027621-Heterocapsa_arctica.AAC.1